MTDADGSLPGNAAHAQHEFASALHKDQDNAVPAVTAGSLIRQAREAAGLHIAALAVALKVPVKKLEALESDRLDLLPDAVFVRALAASVCRTLKIDAVQVLALLPQTSKPSLGQQSVPINAPFRSPGDGPGPSLMAQISRPAVLSGLLLLLGAVVLIFLPAIQQRGTASQPAPSLAASLAVVEAPSLPPAALSGGGIANADSTELDKSKLIDNTVQPVAVTDTAPVAMASDMTVPASPPATAVVPPVTEGLIVFKATAQSWVEVTDAKGTVVLRRTLTAGEQAGASGVPPLAAVVGRVDATQVEVRGKPFDLAAVSKDNVARFEVK